VKSEGCWFGDPDWCISNDIPCYVVNQKPGDLVLLGPGCQHWVRAHGVATQTAWNFASWDYNQLFNIYDRFKLNRRLRFKSIIPTMSLLVDVANNFMGKLSQESLKLIKDALEKEMEIERQKWEKAELPEGDVSLEKATHLYNENCNVCQEELFIYYAEAHHENQEGLFYCPKCLKQLVKKGDIQVFSLHKKIDTSSLRHLIKRIELRLLPNLGLDPQADLQPKREKETIRKVRKVPEGPKEDEKADPIVINQQAIRSERDANPEEYQDHQPQKDEEMSVEKDQRMENNSPVAACDKQCFSEVDSPLSKELLTPTKQIALLNSASNGGLSSLLQPKIFVNLSKVYTE